MGPPMVAPNWLRCNVGLKVGRAEHVADGVQIGVAQELVGRAVKLVGAGAHHGVHHRAAHAPVLGAVVAGDHFEFGHRVRRRLHHLAE